MKSKIYFAQFLMVILLAVGISVQAQTDSKSKSVRATEPANNQTLPGKTSEIDTASSQTNSGNPNAGSNNYIQNQNSFPQNADFYIDGTGKANIFDAATQYNIGGNRVLATPSGTQNTFTGIFAGAINTTGNFNSFYGYLAGRLNTIGGGNAFFGTEAGRSNTEGSTNSFFGRSAGISNTTGGGNSFFGVSSGYYTTMGFGNTFLGSVAGFTNITGNQNTLVGAQADVGANNLNFATAIGAQAVVSTSNTIALGRPNGADKVVIPGLGTGGDTALCWNASMQISTCASSLRFKTNVKPFSSGLDLVKRLQPITFDWTTNEKKDLGLGAEEVAGIEPLLVNYNKDGEVEGVKYDRIGVVLLNAVKQQQSQIEAQEKQNLELRTQIEQQQKQIEEQKTIIEDLRQLVCSQNLQASICQPKENQRNEK